MTSSRPVAAEGEVLVRVTAASLNPHDAAIRSGHAARYMDYRYPVVLGSDFAGVIEAVGENVNGLSRVTGSSGSSVNSSRHADHLPRWWPYRATGSRLTPPSLPTQMQASSGSRRSVRSGASTPSAADAGQVVLVNGATGGIGGYVIQLLAERGVQVIATSRAGEEEEYVRALGAAETVNWTTADLQGVVADRHPSGVDAIVDLVTPDAASLTRLARAVRPARRTGGLHPSRSRASMICPHERRESRHHGRCRSSRSDREEGRRWSYSGRHT